MYMLPSYTQTRLMLFHVCVHNYCYPFFTVYKTYNRICVKQALRAILFVFPACMNSLKITLVYLV